MHNANDSPRVLKRIAISRSSFGAIIEEPAVAACRRTQPSRVTQKNMPCTALRKPSASGRLRQGVAPARHDEA
jgi:hypothetical protein